MKKIYFLLFLFFLVSGCKYNHDNNDFKESPLNPVKQTEPSKPTTPVLKIGIRKNYEEWLKNTGLNQIFTLQEITNNQSGSQVKTELILSSEHTGHIEDKKLHKIYEKLFLKYMVMNNVYPSDLTMKIMVKTDYCNVSIQPIIISYTEGSIQFKKSEIIPPKHLTSSCRLDLEGILNYENKISQQINNSTARVALPQQKTYLANKLKNISSFFKKYYESKGGKITFTNDKEDYKSFNVRNLKQEIIKDSNLWEKISVSVIFRKIEKNQLETILVLDGQYSSGFKPPKDYSYSDMEPRYSGYLQEYGQQLMTKIDRYILSNKDTELFHYSNFIAKRNQQ